MNKILAAIEVLYRGKELANKEAWKNAQTIVGILTALIPALAIIFNVPITGEQTAAIAAGVAAVVGVFNAYATVGTSASVGLQSGPATADQPGQPDRP